MGLSLMKCGKVTCEKARIIGQEFCAEHGQPQRKAQPDSGEMGQPILRRIMTDEEKRAFQRGQQATVTKVLYLCKTMNVSNIWANRNKIMEICEQAQGEAEKEGRE